MPQYRTIKTISLVILVFFNTKSIEAGIDDYYPYNVGPSASRYGDTGIYETPNARVMDPGSLRFTFSSSFPNEFTSVTASPFDWMEATYRYAEIKNQFYGPARYSGNQSWKDKGFDLKLRLLKETISFPETSVGLRDIAGTGVFSSEYIVFTKSFGNLDLTTGLGWGILGLGGDIKNPLGGIRESFNTRNSYDEDFQGGSFNIKDWFSGEASVFGGIEYDLKKLGLRFKMEYDTSYPDRNTRFEDIKVKSRVNLGVDYFFSDNLVLGLGFEKGNQLMFTFAISGNFSKDTLSKKLPKKVGELSKKQKDSIKIDKSLFYRSLNLSLRSESIYLQGATLEDNSNSISVASTKYRSIPRLAGRSARIASTLLPDEVDHIEVEILNGDIEVASIALPRDKFDSLDVQKITPNEVFGHTTINSKSNDPGYKKSDFKPSVNFPEFHWNMSPALRHQIGGPEAFYLGQLWWRTETKIKFQRNLTLYTTIGLDIYNNFNEFSNPSGSQIQHVRSDIQDYLLEGKNNIQMMKLEYLFSPTNDLFARVDLGLLEDMFGGFGGEVFYRPFNKKFSIGFSAHKVKQREYKQRFGFQNYSTITGHLKFYYETESNIIMKTSVGKYLAGDKGISIDLARKFDSGFSLGIFATKTDLPTDIFGEGSFDKGFYFSIPTELFYTDYRPGNISFGLHPLTKDGGAFLSEHNELFGLYGETSKRFIKSDWQDISK